MKSVYAMIREDGAVKVGASDTPTCRVKQVARAVGQSVSMIFHTEMRADAEAVESTAHKLLADRQRRSEWFDVTPDEATAAISRAVAIVDGHEEDVTDGVRFWRNRNHQEAPLDQRLQLVTSRGLMARVDKWRGKQEDLPTRSEAIRRMIDRALKQPLKDEPK